jgi:hypothetical protein
MAGSFHGTGAPNLGSRRTFFGESLIAIFRTATWKTRGNVRIGHKNEKRTGKETSQHLQNFSLTLQYGLYRTIVLHKF